MYFNMLSLSKALRSENKQKFRYQTYMYIAFNSQYTWHCKPTDDTKFWVSFLADNEEIARRQVQRVFVITD